MKHIREHGPRGRDDVSVMNAARAYDYYLNGSHNAEADRDFARRVFLAAPTVPAIDRQDRTFLTGVLDVMLDADIRQFLDLGSGIPAVGNVYDIAQLRYPTARVVYVDHEPVAVNAAEDILKDNNNATVLHADQCTAATAAPFRLI